MFLLNVLGKVRWGAVNKYQSHIIMAYSTVSGCWMIQLFSLWEPLCLPSLQQNEVRTELAHHQLFLNQLPDMTLGFIASSPGSIFQQCLAFAKFVSKRVESVLSGRSDALQRRLIVLPWNSHLIAPLSTSRWLCRFARTKHLFFVKGLFR